MKLQNNKILALCYFDADSGRDVDILLPVIFYAEKYLNIKIEKAFIFDIDKIRRRKPDIVIIANTIGSKLHHQVSQYVYQNNIKLFALISEGNFRTNGTFDYWGYNTDKYFFQEFICLWSNRTKEFLSNELPQFKHKIVLTGATGFDRYKILKFESKASFLKRYNLSQFKKVIGYAGWAFGKLHNPTGLMELKNTFKDNADEMINWMIEQQHCIETILRDAITNNPDILFILKRHPNEIHPHLTQKDNNEMINLSDYPNVLYLRNEEDVHTLINVSDIWTAFESTTVLETWLMKDSPTIFINPEVDFERDKNYLGTVIVQSSEEFQNKIDEFYKTGKIAEMSTSEKINARNEIVKNVIGFDDGMNHIRAGYYLSKTVENIENDNMTSNVKFNLLFFMRYFLMLIGQCFYIKSLFIKLPKFKKTLWIFDRFKLKNIEPQKEKYYQYLEDFHTSNKINEKINNPDFWNELFNS